MLGADQAVARLVFGYSSPASAVAALELDECAIDKGKEWNPPLVARLRKFAARGGDDFRDVAVADAGYTDFQRRVMAACRRIPYGATKSYAELASAAGAPGAARAAGTVMATNRLPLIVPCHRVVAAGGRLGGYSNRLGTAMKTRLLQLETDHPLRKRPQRPVPSGKIAAGRKIAVNSKKQP